MIEPKATKPSDLSGYKPKLNQHRSGTKDKAPPLKRGTRKAINAAFAEWKKVHGKDNRYDWQSDGDVKRMATARSNDRQKRERLKQRLVTYLAAKKKCAT